MLERKLIVNPMFIGLYVVLLSVIFSPSIVFAQESEATPAVLPDSIFYGLKLAIENIQEAFTFQDEKLAELILKHAEERDLEAVALEKQGKEIPLEKLRENQAKKLMKAEEIIKRLESTQKMIEEKRANEELTKELQMASNDQERIKIQEEMKEKIRSENARVIEPDLSGKPKLIEPTSALRIEKPIEIREVEDIKDSDSDLTVLQKLQIRLENSFSTSEITEIRAKFAEVRAEDDPVRKELLASQLDEKVNSPVTRITCFGRVNTLSLALSLDPVKEIQEQCPILKAVPTEELRTFANNVN